ncbi:Homing endonuclease [Rhypophila sp. PSN 637]
MASPYSDIRITINFAICWNSLVLISTLYGKNLISYTQSADNLSLYSLNDNKQRFVEGDGAIQTYDQGKRTRFVLTQKESAILYKIQYKLNIGVIKHFPQGKSALLFNGHLAQKHRIKQLALWVNYLNNRFGHGTIKLNDTPCSITLQDGCFNVSITKNSRYTLNHVIKMRYILDQKDCDILNKIHDIFGFGKVSLRSGSNNVYRYTVTGFKVLNDVITYFKSFPLQTKKSLSLKK